MQENIDKSIKTVSNIDLLLNAISSASYRNDRAFLARMRSPRDAYLGYLQIDGIAVRDDFEKDVLDCMASAAATLAHENRSLMYGSGNFGSSMRELLSDGGRCDQNAIVLMISRMQNCFRQEFGLFCSMILKYIKRMAREGVAVNVRQLYWDLQKWGKRAECQKVAFEWTREFFFQPQEHKENK